MARGRYAEMRLNEIKAEIAPDAWPAPTFTPLDVRSLSRLPKPDRAAKRPGVYFLFRGRPGLASLLYVGSSDDVDVRVRYHRSRKEIRFDLATWLSVAWPWHLAVEALYIRALSPPHNREYLTVRNRGASGIDAIGPNGVPWAVAKVASFK